MDLSGRVDKKRKSRVLEEDVHENEEPSSAGPFVLSLQEKRSSTSAETLQFVESNMSTSALALLDFLRRWGFDSRVGGLSCAPVTVLGTPCLLVSLRLVALLAQSFSEPGNPCRSLSNLRGDKGIKSIQRHFLLCDVSHELRRLAEAHLPLWPFREMCTSAELREELRLLDLKEVGTHWKRIAELPGADEALAPKDYLDLLNKASQRARRAPSSNRDGLPRAAVSWTGFGKSLGRSVANGEIDDSALNILMNCLGKQRAPQEHVGYGWRLTGTRMRSLEEVEHDQAANHAVGAAEVLAQRSVPLPDLNLSWGPFALLQESPTTSAGVVAWIANNPEAFRLLSLTLGRRLVGTPQTKLLQQARDQLCE